MKLVYRLRAAAHLQRGQAPIISSLQYSNYWRSILKQDLVLSFLVKCFDVEWLSHKPDPPQWLPVGPNHSFSQLQKFFPLLAALVRLMKLKASELIRRAYWHCQQPIGVKPGELWTAEWNVETSCQSRNQKLWQFNTVNPCVNTDTNGATRGRCPAFRLGFFINCWYPTHLLKSHPRLVAWRRWCHWRCRETGRLCPARSWLERSSRKTKLASLQHREQFSLMFLTKMICQDFCVLVSPSHHFLSALYCRLSNKSHQMTRKDTRPHVRVSLGETLKPKVCSMARPAPHMAAKSTALWIKTNAAMYQFWNQPNTWCHCKPDQSVLL